MKHQWYRKLDPVIEKLRAGCILTVAFDCYGRIGWMNINNIYIQKNIADKVVEYIGKRWVRLDDGLSHIGRFKACVDETCTGDPCVHN